jgi:hypothetical protein
MLFAKISSCFYDTLNKTHDLLTLLFPREIVDDSMRGKLFIEREEMRERG